MDGLHLTALVGPLLAAGAKADPPRWGMLGRAVGYANDQLGSYRYREQKAGREPDPAFLSAQRAAWCVVLQQLVAAGGNLERADKRGWTPLFDAVNGGDPVLLRKLVELGADLSRRVAGGTVLHFLAQLRRLPEPEAVMVPPPARPSRAGRRRPASTLTPKRVSRGLRA